MQELSPQTLLQEDAQTTKDIGRRLWWVKNRARLFRWGVLGLVSINTVLILFAAWVTVDTLFLGGREERRRLIETVSLHQDDLRAYSVARAAAPLVISDVRVFVSGEQQSDFYAQVENTNEDWWAEFTYRFAYEGGVTLERKGFVLPQQQKPLTELGVSVVGGVAGGRLEITSVSWRRINHHVIKDYATWANDRLSLEIQNPTISQETVIEQRPLFRTSFTVKNNSAFHLNEPVFYVLLRRGGAVLGVNKTTLATLSAGEERVLEMNWFGTVPSASQIEVVPEINIFDPEAFEPLNAATPSF